MKVGFTGTRKGMLTPQREAFIRIFDTIKLGMESFHHGDCTGADAEAHGIVDERAELDTVIVIHPPENKKNAAFCGILHNRLDTVVCPDNPYLVRNEFIVDNSDLLLATPKGMGEEVRGSGTWHAIKYARRSHKVIWIIWPSGGATVEIGKRRVNFGRRLQIPLQYRSLELGVANIPEG